MSKSTNNNRLGVKLNWLAVWLMAFSLVIFGQPQSSKAMTGLSDSFLGQEKSNKEDDQEEDDRKEDEQEEEDEQEDDRRQEEDEDEDDDNEGDGDQEDEDQEDEDQEDDEDEEQEGDEEGDEDDDEDDDEEEDEEEEEVEISREEVIAFAKKHLPRIYEELEEVLEESGEDEEFVEEVFHRGRELILEHRHIQENFGKQLSEQFLAVHRIEFEMEELIERFHDSEEGDEDRDNIKAKITDAVKKRYQFELQLGKAELKLFREEIKQLEAEIKEQESNMSQNIEEEIRDLLEGEDEFDEGDGDDDDEFDRDEDVEEIEEGDGDDGDDDEDDGDEGDDD